MANKILKAKITADARKFRSEMQKVRSSVSKTATFISGAMATGVGLALIKATNDAIKFETAMRNVNTIAQLSERDFKQLSTQVLDLSATIGTDLIDTTLGLYQTLSRQIPTDNAIEFMQIASESAIGGMSDVESSVKVLTSVLKSFGLGTMAEVRDIADAMFVTVKDGAVTFQELTNSLGLVAPIAAKTGVSMTDMMTAIAAISVQGLTAEQTMTALKGSINGLLSPTPALKAELAKMLKVANASDWRDLGFLKTMQLLEEQVGGNAEAMKKLFPNIRGLLGAFTLTGESVGLVNKVLADMNNRVGASKKAYLEMEKATSRSMAKLGASVVKMGVLVGTEILPLVEESAKDLIKQIKQLADSGELQQWGRDAVNSLKEIVPMLVSLVKFITSNAKSLIFLGFSIKGLDLMAKTYQSLVLIRLGLVAIKQQKIIGVGAELAAIGAGANIANKGVTALVLGLKGIGVGVIIAEIAYMVKQFTNLKTEADKAHTVLNKFNGKAILKGSLADFKISLPAFSEAELAKIDKHKKKAQDKVDKKRLSTTEIAKKQAQIKTEQDKIKANNDIIKSLNTDSTELEKAGQDILKKLLDIRDENNNILQAKKVETEQARFESALNKNVNKIQIEIATIDNKRKLIKQNLLKAEADLLKIQKQVGVNNAKQLAGMNANQRINQARGLRQQERADRRLKNKLKRLQERADKGLRITKKGQNLLDLFNAQKKVQQAKGKVKNLQADAIALQNKLEKIKENNAKQLEDWKLGQQRLAENDRLMGVKLQNRAFLRELSKIKLKIENNLSISSQLGAKYVDRDYFSVLRSMDMALSNIANKNILGAWASAK